jgi:outer membrane murein-binding lipoprotein Lpp
MNMTEMVFTIIGAVVTALTALAGLASWIYRRGQAAGKEKAERAAARAGDMAKIESLERQLAETRAQIATIGMQAKRRQT